MTVFDNYDLSARNTFRMKVRCARFVEYDSAEELEALDFAALPRPVLAMGGGSNLLFTGDFPGTVLHGRIGGIRVAAEAPDGGVLVEAGAGVVFDDLCAWAAGEGLWGLENLSLIPGEVGAAAVQNIGAYGVEFKDVAVEVRCLELATRARRTFRVEECAYGYRESLFKRPEVKGKYIVLSVLLRLSRAAMPRLDYGNIRAALGNDAPAGPAEVREAVIRIRREKLPDPAEKGSAGSFFKNPVIPQEHFARIEALTRAELGPEAKVPHYDAGGMVKVPAAWMIERLGFKGLKAGNAAVWEKQPLVLVNDTGAAAPQEILALEHRIIGAVREKYGIELHPEVEHIDSRSSRE